MKNIFHSEAIDFFEYREQVFIRVSQSGLTINQINQMIKALPQIKVTKFSELMSALKAADQIPVCIGEKKPRLEIEISKDEMCAFVRFNLSEREWQQSGDTLVKEVYEALLANQVTVGIQHEVLHHDCRANEKILIAKGIEPIPGEDAKCRYYETSEKMPKLNEKGQADHYELGLIHNVQQDDWLGEKTLPTHGVDGMTVKGNRVPSRAGRDVKLKYDPVTVIERYEVDRFVLRAKINGAVHVKNDKIAVENHLIIHGDVDYETGNIYFDGDVTILGTVQDKFTVEATGKIVVKGASGVGAVERIESKEDSVHILGGMNGKYEGRIAAKKAIYLKFVNEGCLEAGELINIQLYAFDSVLRADKVFIDPHKGKVVGGEIYAKHCVVSGSIGNALERQTHISIEGFERDDMKAKLAVLKRKYQEAASGINRMKRKLEIFEENIERLDQRAVNTYHYLTENYDVLNEELDVLTTQIEKIEAILKIRGEAELRVYQSVYPKTMMALKRLNRRIVETMTCSFYVQDNQIHIYE
ncbi:DUF342 domain-containing protein [Fusibacter paucivorans]|uniref:DUF342 domain-containing protein n=1 Tax=Fusibacter paucivorans TaxID=76009 RepID=A0ABS5PNT5_9FIRM|nr:FapA family protein [Fusibacter paucivorans]MBS7526587.1 DUF342 domain-containing protein [Fusibacter paucivorans]